LLSSCGSAEAVPLDVARSAWTALSRWKRWKKGSSTIETNESRSRPPALVSAGESTPDELEVAVQLVELDV
jgi:hypothetical protein